ncbi:hypothetical protein GOP47_0016906, partial [Adiantum capillus-veneris]
ELKPSGYNIWKWVTPQGLEGVLNILSTLQRTGFANTAKTPKELLLLIQSLAIFHGKEGTDMKSGTMTDDESQDPTAEASMHVHRVAPPNFVPVSDAKKDSPLGQDVQPDPTKEVHSPELQQDVSSYTKRWKDVLMPFPISIVTAPLMEGTPPPTCRAQKVLVLDMNGVLLRRYPNPEIPPRTKDFLYQKAFKGCSDRGTFCIIRPDVLQFLCECADIFHLCIWSNCTNRNMNITLKGFLSGMHPRIWKEQFYQTDCVKLPFRLTDIRELQGGEAKPVFVKGLPELLKRRPDWRGSSILMVDDTRYKNILNSDTTMICPPTFQLDDESQDPRYVTNTLFSWLKGLNYVQDPDQYVRMHMISNEKD